jgi:hypothetical protein
MLPPPLRLPLGQLLNAAALAAVWCCTVHWTLPLLQTRLQQLLQLLGACRTCHPCCDAPACLAAAAAFVRLLLHPRHHAAAPTA